MKKHTLLPPTLNQILILFVLLISGSSNAQITTYPYVEDFELGPSDWTVQGNITTWALGSPSAPIINSAASGTNAWATNLTGEHQINEDGSIVSPIFNFSTLINPRVGFSLWWDCYDSGVVFQSSIDNGLSWQNIGNQGSGLNWYNRNDLQELPGGSSEGWSGRQNSIYGSRGWVTVSHSLQNLVGEANVRFRLAFGSSSFSSFFDSEGIGFDNFRIIEINDAIVSIPDSQFEQALKDQGIDSDGLINGQILAGDTYFVTELQIGDFNDEYDITSFEGLQFFQNLKIFTHKYNYAAVVNPINFFGNLLLEEIEILGVPNLEEIIVNQNLNLTSIYLRTNGALFDSIDVSANEKLTSLRFGGNAITNLDLQNNNLIEFLDVSFNPIVALDVPNLINLKRLETYNTNIEILDLTLNTELSFLQANNSLLTQIDLQNGANNILTYLNLINNSALSCVFVDDMSLALSATNWSIDSSTAYIDNSITTLEITESAEDLIIFFDGTGNQVDVDNWLADNGGAAAVASLCGDITWNYTILDDNLIDTDGNEAEDRLVVNVQFNALDIEGNQKSTTASIIYNNFAAAGPFAGNGDTICDSSYAISDFDNGFDGEVNYDSSKYNSSTFAMAQTSGKSGLQLVEGKEVKFPDTGAGEFTYTFRFDVRTSFTLGNETIDVSSSTDYTANKVTVAFDPGPPIAVSVCDSDSVNLTWLYEQLEIQLDVDTSDFNEADINGNVFNPENLWYNESDNLEDTINPPTPLTEISESGVYQFNAKNFLQNCAGEPVLVTLTFEQSIIQPASNLTVQYIPAGNETEVNTWIANNGGATESGCDSITWEWELINFQLNTEVNPDDTFLVCTIEFKAFDEYQNEIASSTALLRYNGFPSAGVSLGFGEFLCGDESYDLNLISSIDSNSTTFAASDIKITQLEGPALANTSDDEVVFPDTGAGEFTYRFDYKVSTTVNIAGDNLLVEDSSELTVSDLTIPFNPGPDKIVCANDVNSLNDLYASLDIIDGTSDPSFNPNLYWTPSTYQGPGEYVFDAKDFLPQCGGIKTTVTVLDDVICNALATGNLIISEVMQNPNAVNDASGQYFEVYNPEALAVNLNGWTITNDSGELHTIMSDLIVDSEDFIVLGNNNNTSTNGGVAVGYQYPNINLSNTSGTIILTDGSGTEIDRIDYDGGVQWPNPNGAAMLYIGSTIEDNNNGTLWKTAINSEGITTDLGSPGRNGTDQIIDWLVYDTSAWNKAPSADTAAKNALIRTSEVITFSTDIALLSLVVKEDADVRINTATTLDVPNIILESTSRKYASLISDGTITGTLSYRLQVNTNAAVGGNDLITPPVSGEAFNTFAVANNNLVSNADETLFLFGPFDKESGDYVTYGDTETETLISGIGYRAATIDNGTLNFNGTINQERVEQSVTFTESAFSKWNLIGNPYPSYLNVQAFLNNVNNLSVFDINYAGIYGYDGDASDGWKIYNLNTTISTTVITPGQGFFVAVNSDASIDNGTFIEFTKSMRAHGNTDDFIQGRNSVNHHLRIRMSTTSNSYHSDFYFNKNSTNGLDPGYDAAVFGRSADSFAIYSHLIETNTDIDMAIQSLPIETVYNTIIPLGVNANQAEQLTIALEASSLPQDVNVYLKDVTENSFTLLNTNDYVFTPTEILNGTGRFFLHFSNSTLTNPNEELNALHIYTLKEQKQIVIKGQLQSQTKARLYDINGRLILTTVLDASNQHNTINTRSLQNGIYLLQLENSLNSKSHKISID